MNIPHSDSFCPDLLKKSLGAGLVLAKIGTTHALTRNRKRCRQCQQTSLLQTVKVRVRLYFSWITNNMESNLWKRSPLLTSVPNYSPYKMKMVVTFSDFLENKICIDHTLHCFWVNVLSETTSTNCRIFTVTQLQFLLLFPHEATVNGKTVTWEWGSRMTGA